MIIEPLAAGVCPDCGADLETVTAHEDALVRHGGYGETRSTARRFCPACGWSLTAAVSASRPPA